jgi:hypothetical protein
MNGTVSVRVLKPSRLFVQLGNNPAKNGKPFSWMTTDKGGAG